MSIDRRTLLGAAGAGLIATAVPARAQQSVRLTLASGYPPVFLWIQELQKSFMPAVNESLAQDGNKSRVEWNAAMAGTLAKVPAMLEAVQTGLCEIAHVTNIVEPAKLALYNAPFYAPFGSTSAREVTEAYNAMHRDLPEMNRLWDAMGLVFLTGFALDDYVLMSKTPIVNVAELKGRKIGGGGPNLRWIEGTGAAGVATTGASAYNDMKAGLFDAVLAPATLAASAKFHEVAPHVVKAGFGAMYAGQVVANKERFAKLPAEVQTAIRRGAARYQKSFLDALDRQVAEAIGTMEKGGAKVSTLSRAERARWAQALPNIAREWAADIDKKGQPGSAALRYYMDWQRRQKVDLVREWDKA
jgi:TRAP-type C4-dicarboxylate transport system substrate-binding protein